MPHIDLDNVDLLYPVKVHTRTTFKDYLVNGLFRKPIDRPRYVKALDQVTLRVDGGECVGIIGRNGAGKSTLLRTIAGVYPTSAGVCDINGKIASLFDIAAGFEWNATGWENIHLRAYLQGETPASLRDKLGAIAAFTELGDMLDLPLKCYSTGRIMLLSFAIAACCEPDVLLIDEFLSTGDLQVREKAIGRMVEMLRGDRIVMIASHDLAFLRQFCSRIIWLEKGRIRADGPAECVIESYIQSNNPVQCKSPLAA
ncbi:MAG: ABC transporter ATP-binding protein [Planctomycetes bacterium]|nr:ABC transporter ATP-binding protein [Planctomycetota bacterium]